MKINKEIEFNKIVSNILKNEEFRKLNDEVHHGISRLDHSLNVARTSYKWAKKLKMANYREITEAALLHDFFLNSEIENHVEFVYHPVVASSNAEKVFGINDKQKNIILSHMFPLAKVMPRYKESWLVSLADKYCAIYECVKYKMPLATGTAMVFILNLFWVSQRWQ